MVDIGTTSSGAVVLGERRAQVPTVSVCIYLPCGLVFDPMERVGLSLLFAEMLNRGTQDLTGKDFRAQFERRGIHFVAGGGLERTVIRLDCLAEHLSEGLRLISEALRDPRYADFTAVAEAKRMLINEIRAREDDPGSIAAQRVSAVFFADPFNRPREGTEDGINSIGRDELERELVSARSARSMICAWCGACTQAEFIAQIERYFPFLNAAARELPRCFAVNTQDIKPVHIPRPTEQRTVMCAFESAAMGAQSYFPAKVASFCLGGGLFSRLFNEVREKRGLVYDISCSHSSNRDRGWFAVGFACAPERFEEASAVTRSVVSSFSPSAEELRRARLQVKLSLAAADQSRGSRCETLASEWFHHGRVRSEDELLAAVDGVTPQSIAALWEAFPPFRNAVEVTVGGEGES